MTDWLDLTTEDSLLPQLPICDPHHHLWQYPAHRYLLDELLEDINSGHNIVKTVFLECNAMYRQGGPESLKPVGETEFAQGIAAMSASGGYGDTRIAAGIVGYADLSLGDAVTPVLEAHMAASPNRFRGIRHAAGWDASAEVRNSHTNPPQSLYMRDDFRQGFTLLEKYRMSFDAWFFHPQFDEFIDLAKAFPNTTIILDHFGGPVGIGPYVNKRERIFAEWKDRIAELGSCKNVHAKLGGINMKLNGFNWHKQPRPPSSTELAETTADWYHHIIKHFGAERAMFESNFPVDKTACSYNVLWNTFKRIAEGYDEKTKAALFHDTACRVYRLVD